MTLVRLPAWEDQLSQALSARRSGTVQSWLVHCLAEVDSTMNYARGLLPAVSVDQSALVLAVQQSAGRGRQGRSWLSVQSCLAVTFLFCSAVTKQDSNSFALVVALVVREALSQLGCQVAIKWPNDLVSLEGKKLAGVLVDVLHGPQQQFYLVGLGVNLAGSVKQIEHYAGVTTVAELLDSEVSAVQLASRIAWPLQEAFELFQKEGFVPFRQSWLDNAAHLNEIFTVQVGDRSVRGRYVGISSTGALLIEGPAGIEELLSGHVVAIES